MISFVENKNINRARWDDLISRSPNGLIYSYSWFLDTVCENWDALIEDDYTAVFPLPRRKKFGIEYIFQPFFANQFGVTSAEYSTEEKANTFLDHIPARFRFVDIGLNFQNRVSAGEYKITERRAQVLQLKFTYDTLKNNYDDNLKRNLRKAENAGITVKPGAAAGDVTDYFRKSRGDVLGHFTEQDYETLTRLMNIASEKKSCFTLGAYSSENKLLAAGGFLQSNNRIIFLKGAPSTEGRELGAMHLLLDYVIRTHAEKNLLLDFGGSVIPNLSRFYKSFGADDYLYLHVKRNHLPFYLRWLKK